MRVLAARAAHGCPSAWKPTITFSACPKPRAALKRKPSKYLAAIPTSCIRSWFSTTWRQLWARLPERHPDTEMPCRHPPPPACLRSALEETTYCHTRIPRRANSLLFAAWHKVGYLLRQQGAMQVCR